MTNLTLDDFYVSHIDKTEHNDIKTLPLVHTCDGQHFRGILVSNRIAPTLCPVFDEDLAYFFYGRPSYRVNNKGMSSSSMSNFPVCLVIEPNNLKYIDNVYPFDTGAYSADLYKDAINQNAKIADFKLKSTFDFIKKFISLFYETNENYYYGKIQINESDIPTMSFELQSIYSLAANKCATMTDDRCSAIEVQSKAGLQLSPSVVKAVILPSSVLDDEIVSNYLYNMGIEGISYETMRWDPSAITPHIITELNEYYKRERILA
ncbi:hypothetical protein [Pseudoalteromonas sp. EB27]|uniref:hypothetical protein n=1 Tax=Pseudoalteromonas sp. EB27 TaxID=1938368 RepID=UPI0015C55159|nr:hypothetical protein [Pseudoalteromonas sp. EB27]